MWIRNFIEVVFSLGLFVNATLFIPQIICLYKAKSSKSFSLLTFGGFCFIQFFTVLHGYINDDWLLTIFMGLSLLVCGSLTVMIIYYRMKDKAEIQIEKPIES